MSEMVERVAKAIKESALGNMIDNLSNEDASLLARTAIEAMREPTHAIFMAGRNFAIGPREADSVRERWKKQIDAALDPFQCASNR